jgi:uncharacterized protein (UPF0332 family)
MQKQNFLDKLKFEKILKLIEPSEEISKSFLIKSEKCAIVAKLAFNEGIYENALSEAYYSIYNTVTALFYKCGIKCENHTAAVILIQKLFKLEHMYKIFSDFKKDRIDNQYYVPVVDTEPITKEQCNARIKTAQRFNVQLRAHMEKLTLEDIKNIRKEFEQL